jgi:hypothetical protein
VGGTGTSQNGYSGGRGIGSNGGGGGGANGNATTINTDGYGGLGLSSNITGTNIAYGSGGAGYGENPTANTGGGGGANLYGGSNAVGANGTVIISYAVGNATTGATSALKLSAGSGNVTLGSTVSNISSLEVNAGSASSIAGAISGIGSTLTNSGSGTLNVNGAATYTGLTTVNTSSIVFTNNSTPTTSGFAGAGNITIQPNVSSSFTSNFTPTYTYASTLTGLVLGSTSNRANISIGSDIGIAGPISIYGGIVNVSSNLASSNTGDISLIAYSNITNALNVSANILKTGGGLSNISLSSYGGVLSSGNITASNSAGANVVLWSGVGNATSNSTVTVNNVTTNGGNLWVGGSNTTLGSTVWHGLTVGNSGAQINLCGSLSVGAGDVMLWQKSGASMNVTSASITDTTGTIVLVSDGYSGTGLAINSNGTLNLESSSGNFGGGFIWNGTYGSPATSLVGSNTLSNVTINNLNPGLSANTTSLQNLVIGNYTGGGQSSDTVYSFANTGNITVGNHIFMPNSIVLQGKDLVLNAQIGAAPTASLSDPTKGLTLVSSGNVSEYTGLPVLNNDVRFIGGNITLTASNLIDQMSATGVGNLTIANNYGFSGTTRTLGLEGISASGLIKIQNTGAISVDQNVVTTSTANASASPAILLAAGSGLAVGNTTAGFDLYMNGGTVSTGANGLSLIYTGSIANSTGVTTSVGSGSGKFRYNSTLASTGYNTTAAPLTTGVYAIYRESPTLNLTQASNTSVYGVANSSNANTYNNITFNAVNGDSLAQIFGSTPTVTISGGLSSTNYYNAGTHGINITQSANNLGYGPVNYTNGTLTITQAPLGITANSTYNGVTTFNNLVNGTSYNLTGLKNGEVIASANLTVSNSNVSANGSNYVTGLTVVSGNASISNYNITTAYNDAIATNTTNTFTLAQANLTITANNTSTQYGLGTTLGTTAFTPVGLQNSETIGGVTLSSAGVANTTNVGLYNITATGATGGSFIASNYNIGYVNGTLNITQAPLTLVAGNLTRTYGAANPTTDTVTLAGGTTLYNGNTIGNATVSSPAISTTNAGQTANLTPSAVAFTNGLASNYNITYTNGALTISQAPLGITANSTYNGSTNFNGSVNGTNYNLTGLQNGETILTANLAVSNANVASANNFVTGLTRLTGTADMSNYVINGSYNSAPTTNTTNTFNLAQANLTITANSSTKVYGQNITYSGTEFTPVGLQGSDTLTAANISSSGAVANASVNGGTNYTIAISNATGANGYLTSNYNISYVTGNLTVTPAPLGIATTGTYSGTTLVTPATYNVTGLVNSETISGISSVVVNNANVNQASYVTSLNLAANSTANMANYRLNSVANTTLNTTTTNTFVLAQANATITPNNDAIFVGQTLPGTYNITINGLVNGETSPAGLVNGTVTNSATANSSAGSYNLTANGFSSTNYHFAYTNGTFTVVPANKLLIQTGNAITTYGTNATLSPTSVQYLYNTTLVANLTLASNGTLGNNTYLYNDPNGGTVTLALSPANTTVSGSGNLNVYNYQMGSSVINQTSSNFNGTTTTLGTLAVSALTVTPQAGNISKVYDGTTSMSGLSIGLSPSIIAGDNVNISGGGAFSQANAGTNLSYTVSGLQLSGTNAANYVLSGGSTFSGSNGTIAPRMITLTNTQVYSGSTVLTNVSIGNLVGNQTLSYSGASANSSHVADNGSNYITAIALSNGSAGGLASNYQLPILNAANAPVVITPAPLTVVGTTVANKIYDGTTTATLTNGTLQGAVAGDSLVLLQAGNFISPNVANGVSVTASDSFSSSNSPIGSLTSDYSLIQPVGLTGNILPATVPATNSWIYQSTMVQGGTTLYLPLPKTQTAASPVALDAIAFNDEIIFLKNSNEESTAMEVSAIKNDISPVLSDWSFGAIPPLTRLPEVDSMKAVEQDGKIFLINTESKRENRLDTVSLFSSQLIERDN